MSGIDEATAMLEKTEQQDAEGALQPTSPQDLSPLARNDLKVLY